MTDFERSAIADPFAPEDIYTAIVRAGDPDRFFIRTSGDDTYGHMPDAARKAELLIAAARDAISSGKLCSLEEIENFIARPYISAFHPCAEVLARPDLGREMDIATGKLRTIATGLMPKHFPYKERVQKVLASGDSHLRRLNLFGIELTLVKTIEIAEVRGTGITIDALDGYDGPGWLPTEDVESARCLDRRRDELFQLLVKLAQQESSPQRLKLTLEVVAEIEWLTAQRWRFERGTAGIQQLCARALLEFAGVETGRYRVDVDPNLEALTSDFSEYVSKYNLLYESPPRFF